MNEQAVAAAWLDAPDQMYCSTRSSDFATAHTCFDVMVARALFFLPQEHRAVMCSFDWSGRSDASINWRDASFLAQLRMRLEQCARDNRASTPCLYKL